ncbi:hypothetical protein DSLASN_00800 [Desulfoluna limicola]|uniref:Uncharacterized protein n=1 Tax=Desulfoluna limicola TaxID=2810562 RepID=A0ABN6EVT5_9BACT|nr:hypothetical protein DSLASN_00800 [Desulfoluna limicola]
MKVINPAVKRTMAEKWCHPDKSIGPKLQGHMYYVAGLIIAGLESEYPQTMRL